MKLLNFVKYCFISQINKKFKQKRFEMLQLVLPSYKPFECLSLDIVGGLNYYIFTGGKKLHLVIDHASMHEDFHQKL